MANVEQMGKLLKSFEKFYKANGGTPLTALRQMSEENTNISDEMSVEELIQLLEEIIKRLKK